MKNHSTSNFVNKQSFKASVRALTNHIFEYTNMVSNVNAITLIVFGCCLISARCRSVDVKNFYDITGESRRPDQPIENPLEEMEIVFRDDDRTANNDHLMDGDFRQADAVAQIDEIPAEYFNEKIEPQPREKTMCIGLATLMAMCF